MLSPNPSTTYFSPRGSEFTAEAACSGIECLFAGFVEHIFALVWLGIIGIVVIAALLYLPKARNICAEEWARTRAERDAFEQFGRNIASMEATPMQAIEAGVGVVPLANASSGPNQLNQIKNLYRETVMAVPHFDDEYGETLSEHMAAEFNEDLTSAVCNGSQATPQLLQALIQHSQQARDERQMLLDTLDQEADALADASSTMIEIRQTLNQFEEHRLTHLSFEELMEAYDEVKRLNSSCRKAIRTRQGSIHEGIQLGRRIDKTSHFYSYLYHPLNVSYPVLSDGTRLLDEIAEAQSRIVRAISRRV